MKRQVWVAIAGDVGTAGNVVTDELARKYAARKYAWV